MPTRRSILQTAVAVAGAPLAPGVVFAGNTQAAANIEVLADIRYPEVRMFNLRAANLNVPISPTRDGDITQLWQQHFSVAWQEQPRALVGLTERPALFMLEQLGWQYGMRVFFQAEHAASGAGQWTHTILRSARPSFKGYLEAAGSAWPAVLADQLLLTPQEVASKQLAPTGAAMANYWNEPSKLYSWIIAPRSIAQHI